MEEQIRAATMRDARTFLSTTAEKEGFRATAVKIHATKTKEEEMVQELLNGWQKGAHEYIPEVKDNNVICLERENVNSLSIFCPTKSKMRKLTYLHQRHQTDGAWYNKVLTKLLIHHRSFEKLEFLQSNHHHVSR